MISKPQSHRKAKRAVALWIVTGVIMLVIQVILGGITRLTGSGLSITEWNIVTGSIPPLNNHNWLVEFEKYKQTPQFQLLNADFTLQDFKFIFFWEWLHRFWARLIAVMFVAGFIYLVASRYLKKEMQKPLLILFLLGALQGIIGWIMVVSGLTGSAVYVKPTRLALHFVFALGLIAYAFLFALQLIIPTKDRINSPSLKKWNWLLIGLLFFQFLYGALMAGHRAAAAAPTWPDINGRMIPRTLFSETPLVLNFIENTITIHFIHRNLAYLILIATIIFTLIMMKLHPVSKTFRRARWMPLILVIIQAILGILTVSASRDIVPNQWGMFEWMAQLHQITGMLFLLSLILTLYLTTCKSFK